MAFSGVLLLSIGLFPISGSVHAQSLTKADVQTIEAKLTKLQDTITEMDKRLTNQITELDRRLTNQIADVDKRLTSLEATVVEMDKRLTNQMIEMDKRLTNQIASLERFTRWAISTLILVVLAVIAVPQILGYFRDKRERQDLEKRLEQLERDVAELKARRIVS